MFWKRMRFMDAGGAGGDGGGGAGGETPPKTFTQEDLDKIVKERLERERKKYADYDDLKKAAEELSKLKDSEKSEVERLKAEAAKIQKERDELNARIKAQEVRGKKAAALEKAGMPAALADRVMGETDEEIAADVEALKKLGVGSQNKGGGGTPPKSGENEPSLEEVGNMSMDQYIKWRESHK